MEIQFPGLEEFQTTETDRLLPPVPLLHVFGEENVDFTRNTEASTLAASPGPAFTTISVQSLSRLFTVLGAGMGQTPRRVARLHL